MSIIPALGRQENQEFSTNLCYIASSRPVWATTDLLKIKQILFIEQGTVAHTCSLITREAEVEETMV